MANIFIFRDKTNEDREFTVEYPFDTLEEAVEFSIFYGRHDVRECDKSYEISELKDVESWSE
jgi:hypothetical protein